MFEYLFASRVKHLLRSGKYWNICVLVRSNILLRSGSSTGLDSNSTYSLHFSYLDEFPPCLPAGISSSVCFGQTLCFFKLGFTSAQFKRCLAHIWSIWETFQFLATIYSRMFDRSDHFNILAKCTLPQFNLSKFYAHFRRQVKLLWHALK